MAARGLSEADLTPVWLHLGSDPHLLVFGDAECGKSNLLRLIARSIVRQHKAQEALLVIADYRRSLLGAVDGDHVLGYAPSGEVFGEMIAPPMHKPPAAAPPPALDRRFAQQ